MKKLVSISLVLVVMILVLGVATVALAGTITQAPNFDGQTWAIGSLHTISWTSSGLTPGDTLWLVVEPADGNGPQTTLRTGLPQNGSVVMAVPGTVQVGVPYILYLQTASGDTYSNSLDSYPPGWNVKFSPAPVSTPASSPWSLAVLALVGLGVAGVAMKQLRLH
jgi:hypothetical protein